MRVLTLAQAAQAWPAFTVKQLRWLLYRASENGLADCGAILRVGQRVLLDADRFEHWLDGKRQRGPHWSNPMLASLMQLKQEKKRARCRGL